MPTLGTAVRSRAFPVTAALKDAGIAALIAFGLFFFLIGLRTDQGPTGALEVTTRFSALAIMVAVVFAASFARTLIFGREPIAWHGALPPAVARFGHLVGRFAAPALLVFALLVPVLFYQNRYLLDLGILVLTYVMLGWGLNIVVGLAGLLDLGYVAFYAVGAYSYALLAQNFGLSFWICLPLAGILAAFWGVLLGFPGAAAARRLSRDRHARLRRDHPPRAAQLAGLHRRAERHFEHPAAVVLRAAVHRGRRRLRADLRARRFRPSTASCSYST